MKKLLSVIFLLLATVFVSAQTDDYDPTNPPEPSQTYKLKVKVEPEEAAYNTYGTGEYTEGKQVYVNVSANTNYVFKRWKQNGEAIGQTYTSFYFTMPASDVELVAEFEYQEQPFDPYNPAEPQYTEKTYNLYLVAEPAGSGTFNYSSGTSFKEGTTLYLTAYPMTNFKFVGWYDQEGKELSQTANLNFTMPARHSSLIARFEFSPDNPSDPTSGAENNDHVDNTEQTEVIITFADALTKALCVQNWDDNDDGELSEREAAAVTTLGGVFTNSEITSFEELKYFTSLSFINDNAFANCAQLTKLYIPRNVAGVGERVFGGCGLLTSLMIDEANKYLNVEDNILYTANQSRLLVCLPSKTGTLAIKESIKVLSDYAFYSCTGLTSVIIHNGLTYIGNHAFEGCKGLCEVSFPENFTKVSNYLYKGCTGLTSMAIPNHIETIGANAFEGCTGLVTVTIGSGVKEVQREAFASCTGLKDVYCLAETIPSATSDGVFDESTIESVTLHVPKKALSLYKQTEPWKKFGTIVKIDLPKHTLTYLVDGETYKSYQIEEEDPITPEAAPTKEGYTFSGWSEIPETMPAHDVTVTGTFSVNKYKLTYKVDDTEYKTYEVEYGATITAEPAPTKEGYTFSGWSEIPETMPAHDLTVTGTFSVNKYKLTYKVDDTEYKTYEVEYGATITPEAAPTKEGYTFSGWSEIPTTMPAHNVTVTGTFSINKYKLVYKVDDVEYKSYEIEYGATITAEPAPTKEGFTFSGWSEIPETMPAHDVTVTGTFSVNKYKLTYKVDDTEYKTYEVEYGATITPEAAPTKEGYTFSGWSEVPATMPAHDVTVTGTFSVNKYKLTYKVDDTEYKTYEVEYGATITAEPAPTKEGYTFSGWSEIPATMPAHDVTITGSFSINKYKLIYQVDGAEYKAYEVEYAASITPEAEPTKEGYTFSGWSEIPATMPAKDVTITGTFSINSYKLTYMIDDKVYKETTYEYGATITPEPKPEGDYDTFEWKDLPQTMPAHDVVVYASYTSGIAEILMANQRNIRIYSPNGKKLDKPQKGLNIVVFNDGTVKKMVVK